MAERAEKLTEQVKLNFSEQEFLSLAKLAALEDRTIPEYLRVRVIRPFMYGNVRRLDAMVNETSSGFGALGGPEI